MTPARWQKIEGLFQNAAALSIEKRAAFLEEGCAGDESLRREVEALLISDGAEQGAFEKIGANAAAKWAERDRHDLVGQTLGRYKILAPLASGGMGEVFLAEDTTLERKAALKLLPRDFTQDSDRVRRFEQEARAASALNHPNIITIYEIGEWEGTRYIASEFIEGETLRERMEQPRLSTAQMMDIGAQVADALSAAHAAGIIHRDIKPANIMLRRDGYIKVLDFGLAKLTSARAHLDVTEPGRVMGTINYMSPEQALGKPLDHRTDIFSLGVVLYELATGRRLFDGESEAAMYDCILHQEPAPLRDSDASLPVELDLVIRRAVAKNPEDRYKSAADFRADLERLAHGNDATEAARVATITRRAARRSRQMRIGAFAALVLAISAAVFFVARNTVEVPNELSRKSIAVLPFDNLNHDEENAALTEGVQDEILTDLARVPDLKVISRTSVMTHKAGAPRNLRQIGQQLRVAYVLEGSVQRIADKLRVQTQLTDAHTNTPLWAQSYERDVADVFVIESEITQSVANQLRAKLSPAEKAEIERAPTSDLTAFNLYTRGTKLLDLAAAGDDSEQNYRGAIDLLNQAVAHDPNFYVAYCQLERAEDSFVSAGFENTPALIASAQAAVDAARRLAPDAADTHLAAARHFYAGRDYEQASKQLDIVRQSLPNDPRAIALSGYIHRREGRWQESTRELERAIEFDPLNADALEQLVGNYEAIHAYPAWAATVERIVLLQPGRIGPRIMRAKVDLCERADLRRLRAELAAILKEDPINAKTLAEFQVELAEYGRDFAGLADALANLGERRFGNDWGRFSRTFGEGMLARMTGDTAGARAAFGADRVAQERIVQAQPEDGPAVSVLGLIDAGLDRKEEALREGRRAVELLPTSKDSIRGPYMVLQLAMIAAWVGEKDLAIEELHQSMKLFPVGPHYGYLKLDPIWDPLRGDPRFEEIVASLAPNELK